MVRSRSRSKHLGSGTLRGVRGWTGTWSLVFFLAFLCGLTVLFTGSAAIATPVPDVQSSNLSDGTKSQVNSLASQAESVQAEIDALDAELEGYTETFNQLTLELDEVNVQMADLRRELEAAQLDHTYRVKKYEDRICSLYKSGGNDELLELLLDADGIEDFFNRLRVVATLADQDHRVVTNLEESTARLNELLARIDEIKLDQVAVRRKIEDQQGQIEAALAEREKTLESIDSQIAAVIDEELERQRAEEQRLAVYVSGLLNGGQVYNGQLPQTDGQIIDQFLQTAAFYQGVPYVWAGARPLAGFDCSGFTQFVYGQHGVSLPHYSGYQAQMGLPVSPDQIQPGDLLAFGYPVHHVGIYMGSGLFIHAPRTGDVVKIAQLSDRNDLAAIRRFQLQPRIGDPAIR